MLSSPLLLVLLFVCEYDGVKRWWWQRDEIKDLLAYHSHVSWARWRFGFSLFLCLYFCHLTVVACSCAVLCVCMCGEELKFYDEKTSSFTTKGERQRDARRKISFACDEDEKKTTMMENDGISRLSPFAHISVCMMMIGERFLGLRGNIHSRLKFKASSSNEFLVLLAPSKLYMLNIRVCR